MHAIIAQYCSGGGDVGNGTFAWMSAHSLRSQPYARASSLPYAYVLSCISIDSDPVTVLPRLGGDFSGEEKMPETGSRPCSSRARSSSVIPVFL